MKSYTGQWMNGASACCSPFSKRELARTCKVRNGRRFEIEYISVTRTRGSSLYGVVIFKLCVSPPPAYLLSVNVHWLSVDIHWRAT